MQDKRKTSKRRYMTVVMGEKGDPSPGYSGGPIYKLHQYFKMRLRHLKGSNRPEGWYHDGFSSYDARVDVRWLWTAEHEFFAPEISFRPTELGIKTATKIGKAIRSIRHDDESPEGLIVALGAVVVEYVDDQKEGCWDDYRPLQIPGEPAMLTIARYAAGD